MCGVLRILEALATKQTEIRWSLSLCCEGSPELLTMSEGVGVSSPGR